MKFKYRNITVPYFYYDKKENYSYYIYNDKKYSDLNTLFNDFLGFYLTYHYKIEDTEQEVHNLNDVVEAVVKYKEKFSIPTKYKKEYSNEEYKYITKLQKALVNNELKLYPQPERELKYSKREFDNRKNFEFTKKIKEKYDKIVIPKKIHSEEYDKDFFVAGGEYFQKIVNALDLSFDGSFYYQFGGTKNQNNRTHFHSHNFDDLIAMVFDMPSKFKIHTNQSEFYSAQELELLTKLSEKLRKLKFQPPVYKNDPGEMDEYCYLKDNNKFIRLFFHNLKYERKYRKHKKAVLEAHKV